MSDPIYKICERRAWETACSERRYTGSADDLRDGFIHFSTRPQLAGTLAKHFAGRGDLVLVAVDPERLGDALKWEPARGGALFPHLYGALDTGAVLAVQPLPLAAGGMHRVPEKEPDA
jgi:uncharacterized protein (DUF952 family)